MTLIMFGYRKKKLDIKKIAGVYHFLAMASL